MKTRKKFGTYKSPFSTVIDNMGCVTILKEPMKIDAKIPKDSNLKNKK